MHQHETYLHYFLYHNGQIKFFNELINPECDCMSLCLKEENKRILGKSASVLFDTSLWRHHLFV